MAIHLRQNTAQEWSCVRRSPSACKKTPRKQDMSVQPRLLQNTELLLDSVLLLLPGRADRRALTSAINQMALWKATCSLFL